MSAIASPLGLASRFYAAPIGKKAVMAVTGAILFGYVVAHLIGNLQIYAGPEKIDAYAAFLHSNPGLLWVARTVLLVAVILHILAAIQLTALKNAARPVGYAKLTPTDSSYASRTMMWSGPIIAAFIIYHIMHFTLGTVHPDFEELKVYHNVVAGFSVIPVSIAYIVAMIMLGFHLHHGVWSMFQSLGVNHPRWTPILKRFSAVMSILIVIGNCSIPISVMTGIIKPL
jgi:succinate dehydrogenase cytochrome b subunit